MTTTSHNHDNHFSCSLTWHVHVSNVTVLTIYDGSSSTYSHSEHPFKTSTRATKNHVPRSSCSQPKIISPERTSINNGTIFSSEQCTNNMGFQSLPTLLTTTHNSLKHLPLIGRVVAAGGGDMCAQFVIPIIHSCMFPNYVDVEWRYFLFYGRVDNVIVCQSSSNSGAITLWCIHSLCHYYRVKLNFAKYVHVSRINSNRRMSPFFSPLFIFTDFSQIQRKHMSYNYFLLVYISTKFIIVSHEWMLCMFAVIVLNFASYF